MAIQLKLLFITKNNQFPIYRNLGLSSNLVSAIYFYGLGWDWWIFKPLYRCLSIFNVSYIPYDTNGTWLKSTTELLDSRSTKRMWILSKFWNFFICFSGLRIFEGQSTKPLSCVITTWVSLFLFIDHKNIATSGIQK